MSGHLKLSHHQFLVIQATRYGSAYLGSEVVYRTQPCLLSTERTNEISHITTYIAYIRVNYEYIYASSTEYCV